MEHGVTWGNLLFSPLGDFLASLGIDPVAGIDLLFVAVLVLAFGWLAGKPFRKQDLVELDGRVGLSFVTEMLVDKLLGLFENIIQHGARRVFPILGTFAIFILVSNLIGLVPGFNPPTDQFNVTVPLALITFFTAHYLGLRAHGAGYIKKFIGPLWWIAPLMLPIELISHLVRPLSLSVRLFGNMTGDHKVVLVFSSLLAFGLPIPFMGLGIFVSCLQAFVFILLSSVYFQDALDHPH